MITGTTRLDLSRDNDANDRRVVTSLYAVPAGTRVILYMGNRWMVSFQTAGFIREYVETLHLDVQGEPEAVQRWFNALRGADVDQLGRWSA